MSVSQQEKRPLSSEASVRNETNIVPGSAPGSAKGHTARGGYKFMKTAKDVAVMAGL